MSSDDAGLSPGPVDLPDGRFGFGWVFPVSAPPVRGGFVTAERGTVTAVGHETVRADRAPLAVLPRTVNLHTHLELSCFREPIGPGLPLERWLLEVLKHRPQSPREAVCAGEEELRSSGTGAALDVTQPGQQPSDDRMVVEAPEILGLEPAVARLRLESALAKRPSALSPHAPYSLHPDVRDLAVSAAAERHLLVTTHLAESPAERRLLERGDGPFRATLETLGVWRDDVFGGRTIEDELAAYADAQRLVVAHGNDLRPDEFRRLARPGASVAYCPRTHAFFGHGRHPVLEMRAAGVTVGLGTDSRASNPDLSVWNEARFLRRHRPDIPPGVVIEMATREGATALGVDDRLGTIELGKSASLLVLPLARPDATDPYEALFG